MTVADDEEIMVKSSKRQRERDELFQRALAEPGVAESLRLWTTIKESGRLGVTHRRNVVRGYSTGANEPCAYLG